MTDGAPAVVDPPARGDSSVATPPDDADASAAWDAFVAGHPRATYLQTEAWARVKAANGWSSRLAVTTLDGGRGRFGARILLRRPRPVPWSFAYAPRGPLGSAWDEASLGAWGETLRTSLGRDALGGAGVAHVRIDPEIERDGPLDTGRGARATLEQLGWRPAPEIQPSVTRLIDLRADETALWSDLRSKWRQYVNKGRSLGTTVEDVDAEADPSAFPTFHRIMAETSTRTGTPIRTETAYRDIWDAFRPAGSARLLFARDPGGEVGAVLLLVRWGDRVVEPYGGMTAVGAEQRANYLLKWEAIRTSRLAGAISYDLWGLVHPGIRQFKEGFGGREVHYIGAWDLPLSGLGWRAYRLAEGRRRGRRVGPNGDGPR
ncbi:MAG: peptidoglycan bridge formation glycyltransferase FemA/FemB family protein [Chloroflexota bacterium]